MYYIVHKTDRRILCIIMGIYHRSCTMDTAVGLMEESWMTLSNYAKVRLHFCSSFVDRSFASKHLETSSNLVLLFDFHFLTH